MTKSSSTRLARQLQKKKPKTTTYTSRSVSIMSYDKSRVKEPFVSWPVPDEICDWIGKLIITWGLVELQVDELIRVFLKATGEPPPAGWDRMSFKRRKTLCNDLSKKVFAAKPNISAMLTSLLGEAVTLQKKRNFIAHGKLRATLTAGPPPVVAIDCTLTAMLGPDSLSLNTSGLENLFYGLGHVAGKLHAIMKGDIDQMPLLASDEKSHLRDFLRNNPPTLSMPE
jgi:hypothetical protein